MQNKEKTADMGRLGKIETPALKKMIRNYLLITFGITLTAWWLLAFLSKNTLAPGTAPYIALHMLGGFGPTIGAIAVMPDKNIKSVLRFFFSCRLKDFKYLLVFILLPALVFAATLEINPEIPGFVLPGIMLMTTLIGGGNEEGGWRGILQPGLEHFMPYPAAVILTSLLWSFWHIPLWFVEDSAQQHTPFLGFCFIGLLLSFWLAAVYRRTRSVFCCMLLHGFTNTLMSSFVMDVNSPLILSLLLLTVLSLLMVYRPFSRRKAGQKPGQAED